MEVNVWRVVAEAVKSGVYSSQGRSRFRVLGGNVKGDQRRAQRKPLAGVPRFDSADSEKPRADRGRGYWRLATVGFTCLD